MSQPLCSPSLLRLRLIFFVSSRSSLFSFHSLLPLVSSAPFVSRPLLFSLFLPRSLPLSSSYSLNFSLFLFFSFHSLPFLHFPPIHSLPFHFSSLFLFPQATIFLLQFLFSPYHFTLLPTNLVLSYPSSSPPSPFPLLPTILSFSSTPILPLPLSLPFLSLSSTSYHHLFPHLLSSFPLPFLYLHPSFLSPPSPIPFPPPLPYSLPSPALHVGSRKPYQRRRTT